MNYKIIYILLLFISIKGNIFQDIYKGWPTPTPHLKDRFNDFLSALPKKSIVAEIGVQSGTFAEFILKKTKPAKLYLIDCWEYQDPKIFNDPEANLNQAQQDALYQEVITRFRPYKRVKVLKRYSLDAAPLFPDEFFDWVYIDANHAYEAIVQDLKTWYPKVKPGGYICGHDYIYFEREGFGVTQAVNEFLIEHNLHFSYLTSGDVYESWAIQKPAKKSDT